MHLGAQPYLLIAYDLNNASKMRLRTSAQEQTSKLKRQIKNAFEKEIDLIKIVNNFSS